MHKEIVWSLLAVSDIENILDYLSDNWNQQVALKFISEVENLLASISKQPKLFPTINKKNKVRKCVITKHNTLYYREHNNTIQVLRIIDSRQHPEKLNLKT